MKKSNIRKKSPIVIMVDAEQLLNYVKKLLIGLIIYFTIENVIIGIQYGNIFTPTQWLINPILNLFILNWFAWIIFILSEILGLILFESK